MQIRQMAFLVLLAAMLTMPERAEADQHYRVRLYLGLSKPDGSAVSLKAWEEFERKKISHSFKGFNVVDSLGMYEGNPERSKVVTIVVPEEDLALVESLAKAYAQEFQQDSVMMVTAPVTVKFVTK